MASNNDPFEFRDFEEAANLLDANRDAVTISIGDEDLKAERQKPAGGFSPDVADDDPLGSDDKTELLAGQKKSAPFWTFEYYQAFFDVETHHVKERIIGSMLPWPGKNFIRVYLRKNPDLYGPFWICTTLVFACAISGNISTFLQNFENSGYKYTSEFQKVTIAATAIFTYAWLVPLGLWGFLLWRNNKILNLVSYSFMEIICVYGYSLSIYIPAVVLLTIQIEWLRWCFIVVALCVSGLVLAMTFLPALRDDNPRVMIAVIAIILLLNALLAVGCKTYFFSTPESAPHINDTLAAVTVKQTSP
uniref:Protein YIPF n=1 Tax=Iconisemion striatum TaxID=60296 RepID=A0A1A7WS60_9TELE